MKNKKVPDFEHSAYVITSMHSYTQTQLPVITVNRAKQATGFLNSHAIKSNKYSR